MSPDPSLPSKDLPTLRRDLLAWYDSHARDLPWRTPEPNPYRTWVSEIMLQQTRVDTVLGYFERFLSVFPDVRSLARSSEDELLLQWEGLGYYRRARLLHTGAQEVVRDWLDARGRWPTTAEEWITVPGVGRYTAAAIASIAFGEPAAVVDGNVKRVIARLAAIDDPVDRPAGEARVRAVAEDLLDPQRPGDHNQAVMELGATVCVPRSPRCALCPLKPACRAWHENLVQRLPVISPKKKVPHRREAVAVIRRDADGALLIRQRPADGMLGRLWELPGLFVEEGVEAEAALRADIDSWFGRHGSRAQPGPLLATVRHAYSHFTVACTAYSVTFHELNPSPPSENTPLPSPLPEGWAWLTPATRHRFALHRAHDKLLEQLWSDQGRIFL